MHECEKTVDVKIKQRHVLSNRQVDSKCRQTEVSKEIVVRHQMRGITR